MVQPMGEFIKRRHFLQGLILAGMAPFAAPLSRAAFPLASPARRRLNCRWQERKHGSYISDLTQSGPGPFDFTQLFIDGQQQILARFPDAQPSGLPNYTRAVRFLPSALILPDFQDEGEGQNLVAIEFDPATFTTKRWGSPELATLCLKANGDDMRFSVRAVDYDENLIWITVGGGASQPDLESVPEFYVENVYEELNSPHEWYLDRNQGCLFYRPAGALEMDSAVVEVA